MAVTPKVKMHLQPGELKEVLGIPATVELLSVVLNCDPLSLTLILSSEDDFDALYAPDGGFEPTISHKTIERSFFD